MDFDEYEYLEKMVDNPEPPKVKDAAGGGDETVKYGEKNRNRSSKHKIDDRDRVEHQSKSSKSEGELRSHDRSRERSLLRHRSPSRDKDKDRHKSSRDHRDKEDRDRDKERNGKERDRNKEREREREQNRDRDRDRGKREYENENQRQKERERSHRSRSQSEKHQSDRDEKDGEKSQDKEGKEREKEREPKERFRENRRQREKKEDATEPEADPERDQRTVFAYQICLKANERDVYDFFSRAGKVRDVRLIMDRNSRRSKGFGYIEFYDSMSVPMAIALSGQILLSQPVMVKPSEAEKNQAHSASAIGGSGGVIGPYSGGARRLYVGNLHTSITEDNLRQVFGAFGSVELVQLPVDETGHCKGFGFVQFARLEDARNALSLNGQLDIAGRTIKVSAVTDQVGSQDLEKNTGDFDDDEGGNLSLDARSRALLMQKLDRSGTASSITGSIPVGNSNALSLPISPTGGTAPMISSFASLPALTGLSGADFQFPATTIPSIDTIGVPSNCLLLKNMFDPSVETEPDFDMDIKDDVHDECSKFGNIKHIHVDKNTAGFVYLKFEHTQSAIDAQRTLHGRWFAGKMITATFMVPQSYDLKFPERR